MTESTVDRRTVLAVSGVTAVGVTALLAGCTNGSSPAGSDSASPIASMTDIEVGASRNFSVNGTDMVITRTDDTTVIAFDATCTHEGCLTGPRNGVILCDCHGGEFDTRTGKALAGPVSEPLASIPVTVRDGNIFFA